MLKPEDVQRFDVDADLSVLPRDVLEFNFNQLAKGFVAYAEEMDKQHRAEVARLRELIGVAEHLAVFVAGQQRSGRKTVRIDDALEQAQKNYAAT